MQGIDRQTRVLELIARLTGELDESMRVNMLIAQRQAAEAAQVTDLARLTVEERVQLEALLTKARGGDGAIEESAAIVRDSSPALLHSATSVGTISEQRGLDRGTTPPF